jgi:hypothetical protein
MPITVDLRVRNVERTSPGKGAPIAASAVLSDCPICPSASISASRESTERLTCPAPLLSAGGGGGTVAGMPEIVCFAEGARGADGEPDTPGRPLVLSARPGTGGFGAVPGASAS